MIIQEFSFGNYRSFKDIQTLNLLAAKIKAKNPKIDRQNVINLTLKSAEDSDGKKQFKFLKSKAIYGANASGKSNIIKALVTFIRVVNTSVKDEQVLLMVDSFRLSTQSEKEPSFFQLIFWHGETKYRYGFEATDKIIVAEWLYATPKKRELPLFIREGLKIIEIDKTNFKEGSKFTSLFENESNENELFRENSLFLSSLASFGFAKLSKELVESIGDIYVISGLGHQGMMDYAGESLSNEKKKKYILNFLKYGDTGIEDLQEVEITSDDFPDETDEESKKKALKKTGDKLLVTFRKKYNEKNVFEENEPFSLAIHESMGTQKLFELSPFIYDSIKNDRPIIIDEFDARFHPLLTKKIIELYNSKRNKKSQIVFITHDTNLLSPDLLRKDQIEFVEKDKFGASHLYSLVEFKGIRNNASFEKDYIDGKFGAIPFLGDFNKLIDTELNA